MTQGAGCSRVGGVKARAASLEARRKQADTRAAEVAPVIAEIQAAGVSSLHGIARALNMRGIATATRRGTWEAPQVSRVLARLNKQPRQS
jgi:hypothetical protein